MSGTMKSTRRPNPAEALAIARQESPTAPPATVTPAFTPAPPEPLINFNLRLRGRTLDAVEAAAKDQGKSMKLVIMEALKAKGIEVHPVDLEDLSSTKRQKSR